MLRKFLVPLGFALAVASAAEPAWACSCAGQAETTLERCRSATWAFAGVVESVEAPYPFEHDGSAVMRLAVDAVWAGDPPAAFLAYTGGPCGWVMPPPGTPYLVCEDADGFNGESMAFGYCWTPLFSAAPEIRAGLGPGRPPTAAPRLSWQWWRTQELLLGLGALIVLPGIATVVGAAIGRMISPEHRVRGSARAPVHELLALGVLVIAARLVFRAAAPDYPWRGELVMLMTIGLAALVGLWLGFRGQRRRGGWSGLAVALAGTGSVLLAGLVRLHAPLQPADADACSEARAREFLRTAPIDLDLRYEEERTYGPRRSPAAETARAEGLALAAEAVPYACNDWGLQRMRFVAEQENGPCVDYDDGYGVRYEVCARSPFVRVRGEPGG